MALDVIINIHPEMIRTREEVVSILDKINDYEKEKHCEAGVVLKQNRQLGWSYRIVCKEEAERGIKNPGKCEWYVEFYSRSHFEEKLREYSI